VFTVAAGDSTKEKPVEVNLGAAPFAGGKLELDQRWTNPKFGNDVHSLEFELAPVAACSTPVVEHPTTPKTPETPAKIEAPVKETLVVPETPVAAPVAPKPPAFTG